MTSTPTTGLGPSKSMDSKAPPAPRPTGYLIPFNNGFNDSQKTMDSEDLRAAAAEGGDTFVYRSPELTCAKIFIPPERPSNDNNDNRSFLSAWGKHHSYMLICLVCVKWSGVQIHDASFLPITSRRLMLLPEVHVVTAIVPLPLPALARDPAPPAYPLVLLPSTTRRVMVDSRETWD